MVCWSWHDKIEPMTVLWHQHCFWFLNFVQENWLLMHAISRVYVLEIIHNCCSISLSLAFGEVCTSNFYWIGMSLESTTCTDGKAKLRVWNYTSTSSVLSKGEEIGWFGLGWYPKEQAFEIIYHLVLNNALAICSFICHKCRTGWFVTRMSSAKIPKKRTAAPLGTVTTVDFNPLLNFSVESKHFRAPRYT